MIRLWRALVPARLRLNVGPLRAQFSASRFKVVEEQEPLIGYTDACNDKIELDMARIEKLTDMPPPKTMSKVRKTSLQTPDPNGIFRPFPIFPDLPVDAHRLENANGKTTVGSAVFDRLDPAQNFISLYQTKTQAPAMKTYRLQLWNLNRRVEKVRVAAVQTLVEGTQVSEFSDVERVVGIGEGLTLTEARKAARIDLAERMYRVLDESRQMTKTKGVQSLLEDSYVRVALKDGARALIEKSLETNERVFEVQPEPEKRSIVPRKNDHLPPVVLHPTDVSKVKLPTRLVSHPLPVAKHFHRVLETIQKNQVTILSAATGSGKTTQIPQFILEQYSHHPLMRPSVLVTQPRRIAAKSVAKRIGDERGERVEDGQSCVGYSVRFETVFPKLVGNGSIMFCTSGILLKKLQNDPLLKRTTHLIIDEVHERDVYTDLLLLVSKQLLVKRPDLKVILMSATMQVNRLKEYYSKDGITVGMALDIEGTNYPVKEHYLKDVMETIANTERGKYLKQVGEIGLDCQKYIETEMSAEILPMPSSDPREMLLIENKALKEIPFEALVAIIKLIHAEKPPGAILCFLPGWEEITFAHRMLVACQDTRNLAIHLVHSSSPVSSADEIFKPAPPGIRKLIFATNIAESSITIPDVVYVIDSGKQKIMHYDQRHRMNLLETSWISKANLRQRLGRAGRCMAGDYYSLLSEERAKALPEQTPPELLRLGLEEVCLGLKAMGLQDKCQDILRTAVDPPEAQAIKQSVERLIGLGAMHPDESLTPLGKLLANLPVHPAFGRMLILAVIYKCLDPILTVVAGLGERIFKPCRTTEEKSGLHKFFIRFAKDLHSDHLTVNKVYKLWLEDPSMSQVGYGPNQPVSVMSMRRIQEIRRNLASILHESLSSNPELREETLRKWNENSGNEALLRAVIATGFYPDVAVFKGRRNAYQLRKIREVKVPITSCNYEPNQEMYSYMATARAKPRGLTTRRAPTFFVYEDLIDVGVKMVMKTTAVDPLVMMLLANKLVQKPVTLSGNGPKLTSVVVDEWLAVHPEGPESQSDLALISQFRVQLDAYIQWAISKILSKAPLTDEEIQAKAIFEKAILALYNQSSIFRQRVLH